MDGLIIRYYYDTEADWEEAFARGYKPDVTADVDDLEYRFLVCSVRYLNGCMYDENWAASWGTPLNVLVVKSLTRDEVDKAVRIAYENGCFEKMLPRKKVKIEPWPSSFYKQKGILSTGINSDDLPLIVKAGEHKHTVRVQTKASFKKRAEILCLEDDEEDINGPTLDNVATLPRGPVILVNHLDRVEIEKSIVFLDNMYFFDDFTTRIEDFSVSYLDDNGNGEKEWKDEGFCDKIVVECEGKKYRLTAITIPRLKLDFKKSYAEKGYFLPIPNMLIVDETSKSGIGNAIYELVDSRNIRKMKPMDP